MISSIIQNKNKHLVGNRITSNFKKEQDKRPNKGQNNRRWRFTARKLLKVQAIWKIFYFHGPEVWQLPNCHKIKTMKKRLRGSETRASSRKTLPQLSQCQGYGPLKWKRKGSAPWSDVQFWRCHQILSKTIHWSMAKRRDDQGILKAEKYHIPVISWTIIKINIGSLNSISK